MAVRKPLLGVCLLLAVGLSALAGSHVAQTQQVTSPAADSQIFLPLVSKLCGDCYFVDSVSGSDANPGTSEERPWRTLAPVHTRTFPPGSIVHFKRGSTWTGGLVINDSGIAGKPITFTTYGSGARPIFTNPGTPDNRTHAVRILADYVILEGVMVRNAQAAGVEIAEGSDHNVVRDIEATDVGMGVVIYGQYNLVTRSYVHDLHMVRNTPGGNDDYGAMAIVLSDSNNEASYNQIIRCIASSYDFGVDGGAFEWSGTADGNRVHHNWAANNDGFLEVGGGSARDTVVAYNVSINNGRFSLIHLDGPFGSDVRNFRVENNTIVENANSDWEGAVFDFNGVPTVDTLLVRNSIIHAYKRSKISAQVAFTHNHNLYYLTGGAQLGFPPDSTELITNPLFVDLAGLNLHLQSSSPAIDAGLALGYTLDYEDRPVPVGAAPDRGAYEYQGSP